MQYDENLRSYFSTVHWNLRYSYQEKLCVKKAVLKYSREIVNFPEKGFDAPKSYLYTFLQVFPLSKRIRIIIDGFAGKDAASSCECIRLFQV